MRLLPYDPSRHRAACLDLFDGNVAGPERPDGTFQRHERADFQTFLDDPPGPFFVLVDAADAVTACGGWAAEAEPGLRSLCWTVVSATRQGEGLGRKLVEGIVERAGVGGRMRLETIPATRGFFEAVGFRVVEVDPDGYGPDAPPRVEMAREL